MNEPERSGGYAVRTAVRRHEVAAKIGCGAVVVLLCLVMSGCTTTTRGQATSMRAGGGEQYGIGDTESVRVASSKLAMTGDTSEPKVVVSLYEDFLCPACDRFEQTFGPTITDLITSGAIAADYYMVAILDRPQNQDYSSRAGGAAYCVAEADTTPDKEVFVRFHAALFAQQPSETGTSFPDNSQLIEIARQAGVSGSVPECIDSGRYVDLSSQLAETTGINATPTVRINGEDYELSTPDALVAKVHEIGG